MINEKRILDHLEKLDGASKIFSHSPIYQEELGGSYFIGYQKALTDIKGFIALNIPVSKVFYCRAENSDEQRCFKQCPECYKEESNHE